jgi:hypothetical protein
MVQGRMYFRKSNDRRVGDDERKSRATASDLETATPVNGGTVEM